MIEDYLIRDGLDALTVASDIEVITSDLHRFEFGIPDYREDWEGLPPPPQGIVARVFAHDLRDSLRSQAQRLAVDTETTIGNLRGSAELRQAVANTRLQRTVLFISLVALIVAVVALAIR